MTNVAGVKLRQKKKKKPMAFFHGLINLLNINKILLLISTTQLPTNQIARLNAIQNIP